MRRAKRRHLPTIFCRKCQFCRNSPNVTGHGVLVHDVAHVCVIILPLPGLRSPVVFWNCSLVLDISALPSRDLPWHSLSAVLSYAMNKDVDWLQARPTAWCPLPRNLQTLSHSWARVFLFDHRFRQPRRSWPECSSQCCQKGAEALLLPVEGMGRGGAGGSE